jgi:23S rRNA (guanine2535-N1)-methyltransferase
MTYRYALTRESYADLSGGVLHSAPGFPAFPVRLASEMFQRALAFSPSSTARVWDPCCGSGYLLTALALLHRRDITSVLGTDLNPAALVLARKNVDLLSERGMGVRSDELRARAERLEKPAYLDAAAAAQRLVSRLAERSGALSYRIAQADVFNPDQLRHALDGQRPNLVITDVPYGEQTSWGGPGGAAGINGMLSALEEVLEDDAVIAVATRGRKAGLDRGHRPIASFKIGTRVVVFCRVAR